MRLTSSPLRRPARPVSAARQHLFVWMCQQGFGEILDLPVKDSDPALESARQRIQQIKPGSESGVRVFNAEYLSRPQVLEFLEVLDRLQNGTIARVTFRHGIPFTVELSV